MDHGSGGRASHRLINGLFRRCLAESGPESMDDAACLDLSGPLAFSTDSFTVDPLFFPGGDIGSLAVHGTVNDLAMLGAVPRFLSCAFIIEEGFELDSLERIVLSMAEASRRCQARIATGDTKVVPKGGLDRLFINTSGIGALMAVPPPAGHRAAPGDAILVSGDLGDHGLTIMNSRSGFGFKTSVQSDSAPLIAPVQALMRGIGDIHVLRDPTRGGLATTLAEIAEQSGVDMLIDEEALPVNPETAALCRALGLDPLYLANEGKFICILPSSLAEKALEIMRADPLCRKAARIGTVDVPAAEPSLRPGRVILRTVLGGRRLLNMLEGRPLPRIC